MTSPLLALFGRSVREDVRTRVTYYARAGLVLVILLFMFSASQSLGWGGAPGLRFFGMVIYINVFFIFLAGFSYFAAAITEEKEEMTLGLLRMTNLDPLSILLGKSTSRLLGALLLLVAQLPFTLLAIALGGVAVRQILAAYCTLGAFLFFLANLSLLASVICRRTTAAATLAGVTLFVLFAVVPWIGWMAKFPAQIGLFETPGPFLNGIAAVADFVNTLSPLARLSAILRTGFNDTPLGAQVGWSLALGAACFGIAWLVFDKFCNELHEAAPKRAVARRKLFGAPGRAWSRALAWKDFHFLCMGKVGMVKRFVWFGLLLVTFALLQRCSSGPTSVKDFGYFTIWLMWFLAFVESAFIAASLFRQERQWMTLSSLAMLPVSMRRVAYQKILGCLPALLPTAVYFALGLVCVSDDLASWLREVAEQGFKLRFLAWTGMSYAFFQGVLFLHLTAWLSLYLKRGALPLAIAVHFVVHMFAGMVGAFVFQTSILLVMTVLSLLASVVLHFRIGQRLEALAAEE